MTKRKRVLQAQDDDDIDMELTQQEIELISIYLSVHELYSKMNGIVRAKLCNQLVENYKGTVVASFIRQLFVTMEACQHDDTVHQDLQDLLDVSNLDNELSKTIGINIESSIWSNDLIV